MKTLMCSLAAVLSVALGSAVFAASAKEQQMSGTVVEYHPGFLTIEGSKKERFDFRTELGDQRYEPKVILRTVGNSKFKVAFGKMSEGGPANIGIILTKCDHNLGFCVMQDLNDMGKLYVKSGFTGFHVLDTHAFETARQQVGIKGTVECKRIDRKVLRQSFYYFERKDGAKLVVSCSATDVGDSYDDTFDEIVKTFHVTR
jgi:hypothetical protein